VERHIHEGKRPLGAIDAARELVGPIIADDDHARRGVCAGRESRADVDRIAVP